MEQYTTTCGVELPPVDPSKNFPVMVYKVDPDWAEFLRVGATTNVVELSEDFMKMIAQAACTMYYNGGIGIAANQVGFKSNWFIMDTAWTKTGVKNPRVVINPDRGQSYVVEAAVTHEGEGCLSVPLGFRGNVKRSSAITIVYTNLKGETEEFVATDLDAFCVMHEMDHLRGILFIDYLSKLRQGFLEKKIQKVKKAVKIRIQNHNKTILQQVKQLNIMAAWGRRPKEDSNVKDEPLVVEAPEIAP